MGRGVASHTPLFSNKKPLLNRDDDDNIKKIVIRIIELIGLIRPEAWFFSFPPLNNFPNTCMLD